MIDITVGGWSGTRVIAITVGRWSGTRVIAITVGGWSGTRVIAITVGGWSGTLAIAVIRRCRTLIVSVRKWCHAQKWVGVRSLLLAIPFRSWGTLGGIVVWLRCAVWRLIIPRLRCALLFAWWIAVIDYRRRCHSFTDGCEALVIGRLRLL